MALDWNKPIGGKKKSGGKGKGKGKGSAGALPSKKTMNLLSTDQRSGDQRRRIITIAAIVLVALLFGKFAVFDLFAQVNAKQQELGDAQTEMIAAQAQLGDYSSVISEYQTYMGTDHVGSMVPDALIVVRMIDQVVGKDANINGISMSETEVTVNIDKITLKKVGDLAKKLRKQEIVDSVSVSMADNSQQGKNVSATLTITLIGGETEEDNTVAGIDTTGEDLLAGTRE